MRTRFYLEKRNDSEGKLLVNDRPVLMSVTFNGERVMLGTGIKVDMNGWNTEKQRVKPSYPGAPGLNDWLDTLEDAAGKAWKAVSSDGSSPGPEQFREAYRRVRPSYSPGFFQVFFEFLESGYTRWSVSTYRKVRTIYNHLREFEDHAGCHISFRGLDESFLHQFSAFYAGKGNNRTTTRKAINILAWFLNWATRNGYNIYTGYRGFYRMLEQEPSVKAEKPLYLLWDEVMQLLDDHPGSRKLERVRDLFCFMCLSGLRFTEIVSLRKEDVSDQEIMVRNSRGRVRKIPMNRYTREIYRRYENRYYLDNTAFPTMSIITFNKYLRIIGKEAGLGRETEAADRPGNRGVEIRSPVPLHERLAAGIAVNTFIANALELEIPLEVISTFTGVNQDSRIRQIRADLAREEMGKFDKV